MAKLWLQKFWGNHDTSTISVYGPEQLNNSGTYDFSVLSDPNYSSSSRSTTLTFEGGGKSLVIPVTQAGITIVSATNITLGPQTWSNNIPASGGSATLNQVQYTQTITLSDGSQKTISSGAKVTLKRCQVVVSSLEWYNGWEGLYAYYWDKYSDYSIDMVSSGYPTPLPNNSGKSVRIANTGSDINPYMGGYAWQYSGTPGETYICSFIAWVPVGYSIVTIMSSQGTGGSSRWITSNEGTGSWQTYSHEVTYGSSAGKAFYFALTGPAYGTDSNPVYWYIASSTICKVSNLTQTDSPSIDLETGKVILSSTTNSSASFVDNSGLWVTIELNGKTTEFVTNPVQLGVS